MTSPGYLTVIEWLPPASTEVASVAFPVAGLIAPLPITAVPRRNSTLPVGNAPVPALASVAVKVTAEPSVEALNELATVAVLPTFVTVWENPTLVREA